MLTFGNVIWGARCGESARRVLLGETRARGHAYSVRRGRESAYDRKAPHGLPPPSLVPTNLFDLWAQQWRKRHARGGMIIVRFADDTVLGFEYESDAKRFLVEMRKRSEAFSLSLHPEKTRLIRFGRYAALNRKERGQGKPETFNFLGFTMICGQKRTGGFQLLRRTRRDRMQATILRVKKDLQRRRHRPIPEQGRWLGQVVRGFYAYHAVPTNYPALVVFRVRIAQLWKRVLMQRSQRARRTWKQMPRLLDTWLPRPRILHPWPERRFDVKHPRWEPCA
jgi:RNA-directed DNA polymerase